MTNEEMANLKPAKVKFIEATPEVLESYNQIKDQLLRDIHLRNDGKLHALLYDHTRTYIYASVIKEPNYIPTKATWTLLDTTNKKVGDYQYLDEIIEAIAKRWW